MKTRAAWKEWKKEEESKRIDKALQTILTRTRRYYRNQARKAHKKGDILVYKFCRHKAEWPFIMEDILWKDGDEYIKAGKSYHVW